MGQILIMTIVKIEPKGGDIVRRLTRSVLCSSGSNDELADGLGYVESYRMSIRREVLGPMIARVN